MSGFERHLTPNGDYKTASMVIDKLVMRTSKGHLARRAGISRMTVMRIENHERQSRPAPVGLGMTVDRLLAMPHCGNCEAVVTNAYVRVFAPPGMDTVRVCPSCEDMVREGATVRETKVPGK